MPMRPGISTSDVPGSAPPVTWSCSVGKKINIPPGTRFGHLTVIEEALPRYKKRHLLVSCDCGELREVAVCHLRSGNTQTCGKCLNQSHGWSGTLLYQIWKDMRQRCMNPHHRKFQDYGGRGVSICQEWAEPQNFIGWALSNGYNDDLTLDRKDNSKGYSPGNCRWANQSQQMRNTRRKGGKTSGFIGVRANSGKWQAYTVVNYTFIHLGNFDDPFSAGWVRDDFVSQLDRHVTTNNLTDRRKRKRCVKNDRRGTFKMRQRCKTD